MTTLEIRPVPGLPEVRPGDDLAALVAAAAPWLADGDVLVVTSKIVSKAEGRLVELPPEDPERAAAREAALAAETVRVVARRGPTRIVQTRQGLVLANAGIDSSNVERDRLVLLPADPDASARRLRAALRERLGVDVAVVVTDTMGRPWRLGLVDAAIGVAGIDPVRDYRGVRDPHGNELSITQMSVADELAAAAELVKGKVDAVPVAVVRGLGAAGGPDGPGAAALVRGAEQDLFPLGSAEARVAGLRAAATLPERPALADERVDPELVAGALAAVGAAFVTVTDEGVRHKLGAPHTAVVVWAPADNPMACARAGSDVQRLRALLAAVGLASAWLPAEEEQIRELVKLPVSVAVLGLVSVGWPA